MNTNNDELPILIPPNENLQRKVGRGIKLRSLVTDKKLEEAEQVLKTTTEEFLDLTRLDLKNMQHALLHLDDPQILEMLRASVFSVKSRAGMFDYNLASTVCRQLYNFLQDKERLDEMDKDTVTAHVNALRAIFHANIVGDGGKVGYELLEGLIQLLHRHTKNL